jgi:hypothetical protein
MSLSSRFCVKCGSFCEDNTKMDSFDNKLWCKLCNHYTKTLDLLWDFEDRSLIIIANYTKTDLKPTYSLHENNNFTQKLTYFQRKYT